MHNHDEHEHHHHHDSEAADIPVDRMAICPVTGGVIDTAEAEKLTELVPNISSSQVYISGAESMVEALGKQLEESGLANDNLHQDFFPHYNEESY